MRYLEICCQVFVATMAFRFIEAGEELIELLKSGSENKNTKWSTDYWKGIFEKWARIRGKEERQERYDFPELNEALSQFYAELRKENGQDYEPDSLKVMQAALDRHLRSQHYPKSILRDTEFLSCWKERRETCANEAWENDQTKQKA